MASLGWMLPGCQAEETGEEQSGPLLCPPPLNKEGTVFTPSRKSSTFLLLTCHSPRISRRIFYPMIDGLVCSSQHSPGCCRTFLDMTLFSSSLWGCAGGGGGTSRMPWLLGSRPSTHRRHTIRLCLPDSKV